MSDRFLGIEGYAPEHLTAPADLAGADVERLVGSELLAAWAVWDEDEWWSDAPVVLEFSGGERLELAGFKTDLLLSHDQIDVDTPVDWREGLALEWRRGGLAPLDGLLGQRLTDVGASTYDGALAGLWFETETAFAELFNALDELGVRARPAPGFEYASRVASKAVEGRDEPLHPARTVAITIGAVMEAIGLSLVAFATEYALGGLVLALGAFVLLIAAGGRPWRFLTEIWWP